ncbi:MAG: indolepyruvate oxidoreductase subunit beta family protein [Candidatus Rokuibacteriota bacterium]
MSEPRIISLLVPAVGGQGGGVLAEWVVEAALADGYLVQSTSIPGVAQRTGSTSYYMELFVDAGQGRAAAPVFSLYPVPGALDVLLAPELLEVGRAIELGFPSPARTTIIASSHRLYSIHEKVVTGRGIYPAEDLMTAARAFSRSLITFDALALAREHGTEANAVLLGALAASEVLPVSEAAYRKAIEAKGVQVAANLKGFEVGLARAKALVLAGPDARGAAAPSRRAATVDLPAGFAAAVLALPEGLRAVVSTALARLIDYQDAGYARRYLTQLAPFAGGDGELARLVARRLAVWMTYEDAIRVAQLKTRLNRFERIRRDAHDSAGEIVVTDYLKPDLDELYGILPHRFLAPFARWAERRWPDGRSTPGQRVRTTTISGYLRLWLLARCRRLRPVSHRMYHESARMERWLRAIERCARHDAELAREVAEAAQFVKGYGRVRRRLETLFDDLIGRILRAVELQAVAGGDFEGSGRSPESIAAAFCRDRRAKRRRKRWPLVSSNGWRWATARGGFWSWRPRDSREVPETEHGPMPRAGSACRGGECRGSVRLRRRGRPAIRLWMCASPSFSAAEEGEPEATTAGLDVDRSEQGGSVETVVHAVREAIERPDAVRRELSVERNVEGQVQEAAGHVSGQGRDCEPPREGGQNGK